MDEKKAIKMAEEITEAFSEESRITYFLLRVSKIIGVSVVLLAPDGKPADGYKEGKYCPAGEIRSDGKTVGNLGIPAGLEIDGAQRWALAMVAAMAGECREIREASQSRRNVVKDAFRQLLAAPEDLNLQSIRDIVGLLQFSENGYYKNCVMINVRALREETSLSMLEEALTRLLPKQIIFSFFDSVIVIIASAQRPVITNMTYASIDGVLKELGAIGCLSDMFIEPLRDLRLSRFYSLNEKAIYFALREKSGYGLVEYDEFKFACMLNASLENTSSLDNMQFVSGVVRRIIDYDKDNKTDYFDTLYWYLNTNLSYRETSDILHIHRNTAVYRVSRLSALFGIDFASPDQRFTLNYSCRIVKTMDRKPDYALYGH